MSDLEEAWSLYSRAKRRLEEQNPAGALELCAELGRRFATTGDAPINEVVARAMFVAADSHVALGDGEQALDLFEALTRDISETDQPAIRKDLAHAWNMVGYLRGQLERIEEAIPAYEELLRRFGASEDPDIVRTLGIAAFNKGFDLGRLGRKEEALKAFDEAAGRPHGGDRALIEMVAGALGWKASLLEDLGRTEDALVAYDALAGHVSSHPSLESDEAAQTALAHGRELRARLGR